jgi:sugar transferase EpsL
LSAQLRAKRLLDIVVSGTALALLSPVMAVVASLVRIRLGSPVLFRQVRPGHHAQPFTLLKFRTMLDARDADGNLLPDGDRLTPLGRTLRRYSLDELPQFWNVLRGEMSLVGPRPLLMEYLDRYSPEQARRHDVKPGITGLAQISGRNAIPWERKFDLDIWYADHWSLGLDARILLTTIDAVARGRGVSGRGSATMEKFDGTGESHC